METPAITGIRYQEGFYTFYIMLQHIAGAAWPSP